MDLSLAGRRALVTGSSSGLGVAIATRLAQEGATVVVHGRDLERVVRVSESLRSNGADISVAIGDLGTDEGTDQVRAAALVKGSIDIPARGIRRLPRQSAGGIHHRRHALHGRRLV